MRRRRFAIGVIALLLASHVRMTGAGVAGAAGRQRDLLIFAASSLQTALDELAPAIEHATSVRVRVSYAASSALARQIESGAPAGLFLSADLDWMNYLGDRHLIKSGTRVNLLGNTLVLIAPASHAEPLAIVPGFPLARALGTGRLAIAEPAAVPAGKYAQAALTSLGVWDSVAAKLAPAENVRAALLFVSRGEAPFGIVYRSDALADRGVAIVGTFPATSHPPIVYPAAVTTAGGADAARVLEFLQTAAAKAVFARQGFLVD